MRKLIVIAHNMRSTHNVGSLLRTAEGLGVSQVLLSGYAPYPLAPNDERLPHLALKIDRQITKTSLGAETMQPWKHISNIEPTLTNLRKRGYVIAAIEQAVGSNLLPSFVVPDKLVLIFGREVEGLEMEVLELCDMTIEIPMFGKKESFNVVQAAAMVLYHCRFSPFKLK